MLRRQNGVVRVEHGWGHTEGIKAPVDLWEWGRWIGSMDESFEGAAAAARIVVQCWCCRGDYGARWCGRLRGMGPPGQTILERKEGVA